MFLFLIKKKKSKENIDFLLNIYPKKRYIFIPKNIYKAINKLIYFQHYF